MLKTKNSDYIAIVNNNFHFQQGNAVRGQNECITKPGFKTKNYIEIDGVNSGNSNIDLCKQGCIQASLATIDVFSLFKSKNFC